MKNNDVLILDRECFKTGISIVNSIVNDVKNKAKIENIIQKSIGVLQEDGVFAFIVYLNSVKKEDKEVAKKIIESIIDLLKKDEIKIITNTTNINNQNSILQEFIKLGERIDNLLLAKTLIEKTLIYARYHVKSLEQNNETKVEK